MAKATRTRVFKQERIKLSWFNTQSNNSNSIVHYFYISFPSLQDYNMKMPNFALYWTQRTSTIQLQDSSPTLDKIIVIELE